MTLELLSLLLLTGVGRISTLQKCFKKDSISCFQMEIYRTAKNLFGKSRIDFAGVSLRQAKLLSTKEEELVTSQQDVESRQRALEDYLVDQVKHVWNRGSIIWNPVQTARSLIDSIPSGVAAAGIATLAHAEGRSKDKKQLNMLLLPFLLAVKLKLTALWYVFIALIAKKAVLAGVISLLISGFVAVKKLIATSETHQQEPSYHPIWSPLVQQPNWSYAAGNLKHQDLATSQRRAVPYVHQKEIVTPERNNSIVSIS